ncbi:hypothetical protein YC2023_094808 [Brassica napus]
MGRVCFVKESVWCCLLLPCDVDTVFSASDSTAMFIRCVAIEKRLPVWDV